MISKFRQWCLMYHNKIKLILPCEVLISNTAWFINDTHFKPCWINSFITLYWKSERFNNSVIDLKITAFSAFSWLFEPFIQIQPWVKKHARKAIGIFDQKVHCYILLYYQAGANFSHAKVSLKNSVFFGVFDQNLGPRKFHFCLRKRPKTAKRLRLGKK